MSVKNLHSQQGILIGIDRKSKVHSIATNCAAINLKKCVRIFAGDSTKIVAVVERQIEAGPPFAPNTFDKILLDAACSGTGLRPMLTNRIMSEARTHSFSQLQKLFVDNVSIISVLQSLSIHLQTFLPTWIIRIHL